jgi:hypothetical protein
MTGQQAASIGFDRHHGPSRLPARPRVRVNVRQHKRPARTALAYVNRVNLRRPKSPNLRQRVVNFVHFRAAARPLRRPAARLLSHCKGME